MNLPKLFLQKPDFGKLKKKVSNIFYQVSIDCLSPDLLFSLGPDFIAQ